jgi:hypothetical protein
VRSIVRDRNADTVANTYRDRDGNTNGNADSNTNCYTKSYGYRHAKRDAYAYSHAGRVCARPGVLEKSSRPMAGDRVAAWQRHLHAGGIVIDSTPASPRKWIGFACSSANYRRAEHCQRR